MIPDELEQLLRRIEDTGDHPDTGTFWPGRHRHPWTVARVHVDACRVEEAGRRGAHRSPEPGLWHSRVLAASDAHQLAHRLTLGIRQRQMYPRGVPTLITLSRVL